MNFTYKIATLEDLEVLTRTRITLEATEMGRVLYKKYGFVAMQDEMQLPE